MYQIKVPLSSLTYSASVATSSEEKRSKFGGCTRGTAVEPSQGHPSILEDRTGSLKSGWLTPAIGRNGLIIVLCFYTVLVKLFFFVFRSYGCAHMAMVGLPVTVALHACFRCLCTIWRSIPIYSLSSDQMCKSFPTTWTWVKSKPWANQSLVNFSC